MTSALMMCICPARGTGKVRVEEVCGVWCRRGIGGEISGDRDDDGF